VESGWFQGLGAGVIAMNAVVMGGCLRDRMAWANDIYQ